MKSLRIITIAILTACTLLTACKKDASVTPGGTTTPGSTTPTPMQLIKIEQEANTYTTYGYNADGLLTTTANFHNQPGSTYTTTYDADKRPVMVVVADDEIYKILYNGSKIGKIEMYKSISDQVPTSYFTYNYTGDKVTQADYFSIQSVNSYTYVAKAISVYNTGGRYDQSKSILHGQLEFRNVQRHYVRI
jgi:YD repeat-containing protein